MVKINVEKTHNNANNINLFVAFYTPGTDKWGWYAANKSGGYLEYLRNGHGNTKKTKLKKKKESYVEYQGGREGSEGFFTKNDSKLTIVPEGSNVWDMVISWKEEFAEGNNIFSSEQTRAIFEENINVFLRSNKFNPKNVQWVAAHHSNTKNPHLHIRINEIEPDFVNKKTGRVEFRKKGKMNVKSIEQFKLGLEMSTIDFSFERDGFNSEIQEYQRSIEKMEESFRDDEIDILSEVQILIKNFKSSNRVTYNTLNPFLKQKIDNLWEQLIEGQQNLVKHNQILTEEVQKMYDKGVKNGVENKEMVLFLEEMFDKNEIILKNKFIKTAFKVQLNEKWEERDKKIISSKVNKNPVQRRKLLSKVKKDTPRYYDDILQWTLNKMVEEIDVLIDKKEFGKAIKELVEAKEILKGERNE